MTYQSAILYSYFSDCSNIFVVDYRRNPPVYYFLLSLIVFFYLDGDGRGRRLEKGGCHFFLLTPAIKKPALQIQISCFFLTKLEDCNTERGIKRQNTEALHNLHGYVHCTVYVLCYSV